MRDSKEDSFCRSIPRHSRKLRKLGNVIYYRSFTASTTKPKTLHELPVLRANTQMKFGQRYNTVKKNLRVKFHTPTLLLGRSWVFATVKFPLLRRSYLLGWGSI